MLSVVEGDAGEAVVGERAGCDDGPFDAVPVGSGAGHCPRGGFVGARVDGGGLALAGVWLGAEVGRCEVLLLG